MVPNNWNAERTCYETVLNPLGRMRGAMLAYWFKARHITKTLTQAVATHKIRTRQTVELVAQAAGLGGDVDQAPGDGVFHVPFESLINRAHGNGPSHQSRDDKE